MRRDLRILLATVVLGALTTWGPRLYEAMSAMETFRISDVEVRGLRLITEDSIVARLELEPESSVWGDKTVWLERVESHPLVRSAEVRRKVPNGLLIVVEERRAIALAATPTLEPVDAEGYRLPIDPARYRLDLPIISTSQTPPEGSQLFGEEVRILAAEVSHLMSVDAAFMRRVSTLRRDDQGMLVLRMTAGDVDFLLPPGTPASRLRQGDAALTDALSRSPGDVPAVIDLRFADQVVVRRTRE